MGLNKSYTVALGFVAMAVGGFLSGDLTWQAALATLLGGAGLAAMRHAIEKLMVNHAQSAAYVERALDLAAKMAPKAPAKP